METTTQIRDHIVQIKTQSKATYFLTLQGGLNRLRIHAAVYSLADAAELSDEINTNHAGEYDAKPVKAFRH